MLEADQMNALFDYTRESMADQADSVISAADEQELLEYKNQYLEKFVEEDFMGDSGLQEAMEREELRKLKKKYERVAEKDEC